MQNDISRQIKAIQQKCNRKLLEEKEKKKKMKEQRDYQIYDEMGYTFNSKIFSLAEKHPMSRDRFESAKQHLSSIKFQNENRIEQRILDLVDIK